MKRTNYHVFCYLIRIFALLVIRLNKCEFLRYNKKKSFRLKVIVKYLLKYIYYELCVYCHGRLLDYMWVEPRPPWGTLF